CPYIHFYTYPNGKQPQQDHTKQEHRHTPDQLQQKQQQFPIPHNHNNQGHNNKSKAALKHLRFLLQANNMCCMHFVYESFD
ncbi:MAG: hypothetical protein ACRCWB_10285, partial [Enterovibrio sp.]